MKRYFLGTVGALGLSAGVATAQSATEQLAIELNKLGYTDVEISQFQLRETGHVIHVEAVKDGVGYEYLYNLATGDILDQEARPAGDDDEGETSDDGDRGHGNSDGYDQDNPGWSHDDEGNAEAHGRFGRSSDSDRGNGGSRRNDRDNPGRGRDKGDEG